MNSPIISVVGNSVPLLIQPFRANPTEKTYLEHLRDRGFTMVNAAKQSAVITDVYQYLEDECIRHFPDYVILHFGIVDSTYRARSRWLQNYFSMNAWNNSIIRRGYNGPITRGIKFILKKLYSRIIERFLFFIRLKFRWVRPRDYQFVLRDICKRIFSDTPTKKIIIIGMAQVPAWVEKKAPGTQDSIKTYNTIMHDLSSEYTNIQYVDPESLGGNLLSPDGIHFNAHGHKILAEHIFTLCQGEREQYTEWTKMNQYKELYNIYEHWFKR
jgi:lysophospholipase L1-like esterase